MKIGVVHVNREVASGPYTELITSNLERAKVDGQQNVHCYVQHLRRAMDTAIAYPTLLNKVDVVTQMVALEAEGMDAVMVACSGDPGVAEARSLLQIPVVGPMEAAMGLVVGYGWWFGILTVADSWTWSSWLEQMVVSYGFSTRYWGQWQLEMPIRRHLHRGIRESGDCSRRHRRTRTGIRGHGGGRDPHRQRRTQHVCDCYTGISNTTDPEMPVFDVYLGWPQDHRAAYRVEAEAGCACCQPGRLAFRVGTPRTAIGSMPLFGWAEPSVAALVRHGNPLPTYRLFARLGGVFRGMESVA